MPTRPARHARRPAHGDRGRSDGPRSGHSSSSPRPELSRCPVRAVPERRQSWARLYEWRPPTGRTTAPARRPWASPRGAPTDAPDVLTVPAPADLATMVVGIVAVSTSGPLMAATAAPALAIAFWRNGLATAVLVPWTLVRHRAELRGMRGRERRLAVIAGGFLALHFATWVPSLTFTTVASATALVSTQPVWAALLARRAGALIAPLAWLGIAIAVLGAAVLTGADVHTSGRAFLGDV